MPMQMSVHMSTHLSSPQNMVTEEHDQSADPAFPMGSTEGNALLSPKSATDISMRMPCTCLHICRYTCPYTCLHTFILMSAHIFIHMSAYNVYTHVYATGRRAVIAGPISPYSAQ